jgi:hypothetical protein
MEALRRAFCPVFPTETFPTARLHRRPPLPPGKVRLNRHHRQRRWFPWPSARLNPTASPSRKCCPHESGSFPSSRHAPGRHRCPTGRRAEAAGRTRAAHGHRPGAVPVVNDARIGLAVARHSAGGDPSPRRRLTTPRGRTSVPFNRLCRLRCGSLTRLRPSTKLTACPEFVLGRAG